MALQEQIIADAAIRVIVTQGFDVVSIRKVAAEAKVAVGSVQYFMGTKEQLLIKALARSVQRQQARIAELKLPPNLSPLERATQSLMELLPIGKVQREDAALWVILGAAASTRPALAKEYEQALSLFRNSLSNAISKHLEENEQKVSADSVQQTARLITALVNGLTLDYLNHKAEPHLAQTIKADLYAGLQRILAR